MHVRRTINYSNQSCATALASPEEVQAAVALVKALEPLSPEPGTIANPKVERHWAAVEALARDLDAPATTADRTGQTLSSLITHHSSLIIYHSSFISNSANLSLDLISF